MQVENTTQSQQEHSKAHKAGIARSAIGWIQRVISDSVQEISDFSALLSAEVVPQAKQEQPAVRPTSQSNFSDSTQIDYSFDQPKAENAPKKDKVLAVNGCKTPQVPLDTEAVIEDNNVAVCSGVDISEENSETSTSTEVEIVQTQPLIPEEVAVDEVTENTLAAEVLALQLQSKSTEVVEQKASNAEVSDAQIGIESENAAVAAELPDSSSNPETLALEVDKDVADFVQDVIQKVRVHSSKSEQIPSEIAGKNATINVKSTENADAEPSNVDIAIKNQSDAVAAQPVVANLNSSKPTSTQTTGFADSLMGVLAARYSVNNLATQEESKRSVVEALGGPKAAQLLGKSSIESNAISNIQATNMSGSRPGSDHAAMFGNASSNFELAQKSEGSKSSKPLTRTQSLATMEKVEAALQKAAESKDGTLISLRLDPPSLGSVKVDVSFKEGLLHARLSADSAQVLQLLRDKAPELQVILRKLGLDVDRVSVSVNSGDLGTFGESLGDKQGSSGKKGGNNFPELADSAVVKEPLNLDHWIA